MNDSTSAQSICSACRAPLSPVATFCPNCGARAPQPFRSETAESQPKNAAPSHGVTLLKVVLAVAATMGFFVVAVGLIFVGLLGVALAACFTTGTGQPSNPNLDAWSSGVVIGVGAFCLLGWSLVLWRVFK
jgi:hypothetical protein